MPKMILNIITIIVWGESENVSSNINGIGEKREFSAADEFAARRSLW